MFVRWLREILSVFLVGEWIYTYIFNVLLILHEGREGKMHSWTLHPYRSSAIDSNPSGGISRRLQERCWAWFNHLFLGLPRGRLSDRFGDMRTTWLNHRFVRRSSCSIGENNMEESDGILHGSKYIFVWCFCYKPPIRYVNSNLRYSNPKQWKTA